MLLQYGNTTVWPGWEVCEPTPPAYCRVYWVYSGQVIYRDQYSTCRLRPGFLYLFPSTAPYQMTQQPDRPLSCTFFHLDLFPATVGRLIELDVREDAVLKSILSAATFCIEQNTPKTLAGLAAALEHYLVEQNIVSLPDPRISGALDYISQHYGEDIGIEELSRASGYQPQYFIRIFKKSMGLPPYQYLILYRLRESVRLLERHSISEVAFLCGYPDAKSYIRSFTLKYGMPPGRFRKNYRFNP